MAQLHDLVDKLARPVLDLLFPMTCGGCGKSGKLICESCVNVLPPLTAPYCPLCAQPGLSQLCQWCTSKTPSFDGIRAPYLMEGVVREAIHSFKYRNVFAAKGELATLLAGYLDYRPLPGDVIVPVPLHPRRLRSRGYNQASLLSRELGKLIGLPVNESLIARVQDAHSQARSASRQERQENVSDSFVSIGDARGLSAILVDDVVTTGATMSACAAALKAGGAEAVFGLALSREA